MLFPHCWGDYPWQVISNLRKICCHLTDTLTLTPESVLLNLFSRSNIDADQELIHDVNVRQISSRYVIKTTNKCFFGLDIVINLGGIKYLRLCCMLIRFWGDVLLNSRLTSFLSEQFSHCLAALRPRRMQLRSKGKWGWIVEIEDYHVFRLEKYFKLLAF